MDKATLMAKRARKFNELTDPLLEELSSREKDMAHYFMVGFMSNHVPVIQLERLQKDLAKFVSGFKKGRRPYQDAAS